MYFYAAAPLLRQKGESKSIRSGDRCSTIVLGRSNGGRHKHKTGKDDGSVGDVSNLSSPKMKCLGRNTTNFLRPLCLLLYIDTPIWKSKFGAKSDVLVCRSGRTRGVLFGELVRWWIMSRWSSQIISIVCFWSTLWLCQNSYWKWPEQ